MEPASYLEISGDSLRANLETFRRLLRPGTALAAVVKANAYGHGLAEVVGCLDGQVEYFQVDDAEELARLRRVTAAPALLLGYVAERELPEVISLGSDLAVIDLNQLAAVGRASEKSNAPVNIHLAIDAWLGREGILPADLPAFLEELGRWPLLRVAGAYAHFANIEDTSDFSHARRQIDTYNEAVARLRRAGHANLLTHISATSGILAYEQGEGASSLARLGIGLYGLWPSEDLRRTWEPQGISLRPALRWVSRLAEVKKLPAEYPVGYGLTYVTEKPTTVALIPQGYSDGYDRRLSNRGRVLVGGRPCPVVGRVAMNMLVIDVSEVAGAAPGDEAVLLGRQGDAGITVEEIAAEIGSINYEVVARLSPLLTRLLDAELKA